MNSRRNPGRQAGRFKGPPLYEQMGMMSISEGETMSSGMADFLGGNGSTSKQKSARDRRTNASSRTTTTSRSGSTKPSSQYDTTAESRSDERTPSHSKSATGSARSTINSSSNTNTPKFSSLYANYQLKLFRPRIALNGFNLSAEAEVSDSVLCTF